MVLGQSRAIVVDARVYAGAAWLPAVTRARRHIRDDCQPAQRPVYARHSDAPHPRRTRSEQERPTGRFRPWDRQRHRGLPGVRSHDRGERRAARDDPPGTGDRGRPARNRRPQAHGCRQSPRRSPRLGPRSRPALHTASRPAAIAERLRGQRRAGRRRAALRLDPTDVMPPGPNERPHAVSYAPRPVGAVADPPSHA